MPFCTLFTTSFIDYSSSLCIFFCVIKSLLKLFFSVYILPSTLHSTNLSVSSTNLSSAYLLCLILFYDFPLSLHIFSFCVHSFLPFFHNLSFIFPWYLLFAWPSYIYHIYFSFLSSCKLFFMIDILRKRKDMPLLASFLHSHIHNMFH